MKREYLAVTTIIHDGQAFAAGEVLELTEAQADQLFSVNAIRMVDENNDGKADRAESERGKRAKPAPDAGDIDPDEERPLLDPETTGLELATAGKPKGKPGRKPKGA